jgi:hypothetical protein
MSTSSNSAFSSFNAAPTQAEFIEHGLSDDPIPSGPQCSICVEDCSSGEGKAVKLISCENCYFHNSCITAWLNSGHERRGTCPNDRTVLFIPLRFNHQHSTALERKPKLLPFSMTQSILQPLCRSGRALHASSRKMLLTLTPSFHHGASTFPTT